MHHFANLSVLNAVLAAATLGSVLASDRLLRLAAAILLP